MSKRLIYGVLAEYTGSLQPDGKPIVVGMLNTFLMTVLSDNMPSQLPPHYIAIGIGFPFSEAGAHRGAIRLRDEDGREVFTSPDVELTLNPGRLAGVELTYNWGNRMMDLTVPRCGTYTWEVLIDGEMLGEIPFYVVRHQQAPQGVVTRVLEQ